LRGPDRSNDAPASFEAVVAREAQLRPGARNAAGLAAGSIHVEKVIAATIDHVRAKER
jgi:hypothetical protein